MNIDDLALASSVTRVVDQPINPAAPPAETPLVSGTISNPLQAQAMDTLNKGYNLTSWLEVARPANFDTYNDSYVAKLQAAGFKALRLPIDIGLYVTAISGTGSTLDVVVDPLLWTVLDNFNQWTGAHGLSLTIDYHKSIEANVNADGLQKMVVLWV
jgi:aryl-phospho-beta-D-glucosidase BglC (GH1 family)